MQTFLDSVLDALPDWDTRPEMYHFILPSKRAGFFLKHRMAERASVPCIAPPIESVESFVEGISGITQAGAIELLFELYDVYLEVGPPEKESFHDFCSWGQMLLQDFNEIDRYLVEAPKLFETLSALNELRQWTPDGATTPMMDRQLSFWKALQPVYTAFQQRLSQQGLGYQGQIYREAVGRVAAYLDQRPDVQFIFVGFNALNTAEKEIINHFVESGRGQLFWDADPHYLENPVHDAGFFLRKHRKDWAALNGSLRGISDYFSRPKKISVVGLPKSISQAKYCGEVLELILKGSEGSLEDTAVILGDESLLDPVLHSLPKEIEQVNVTMGAPVAGSPLSQLFEALFDLFIEHTSNGWRTNQVLVVLTHPFLQEWFEQAGFRSYKVRNDLIRTNNLFTTAEALQEAGVPKPVVDELFPSTSGWSPLKLTGYFLRLIQTLREVFQERKHKLGLEYLHHFYTLFNQLEELCLKHPFVSDLRSLRILFQQLLKEERIDFRGEPLTGLQVMGMLESRNLDFKTVLLTSVNEGILPAGKSNASFVPYEVKREFGLPTYKEKDAVYTYHFYRLLQRAEKVIVCYNTEPEVLEGSEPSRFIHQLKTDPVLGPQVEHRIAAPAANPNVAQKPEIPKSELLIQRLKTMAESGFSPTALSNLINDPMQFYRKHVLGIRESDTLEETVAANTFGTVLHAALEDLYAPLVGEVLTQEMVEGLKASAPGVIRTAFRRHYLEKGPILGKNLIALEVMKQYLELFLESERKSVSRHQIRILGVEEKIRQPLQLSGFPFPVFLKGTVDRIEEVDGVLRILDYKTGRVVPADLRISSWESLREDPKRSKALQLLSYAWLYAQASQQTALKAGVVSFKSLSQGRQWFGYREGREQPAETIGTAELTAFEKQLGVLLSELFDPEVAFSEPTS